MLRFTTEELRVVGMALVVKLFIMLAMANFYDAVSDHDLTNLWNRHYTGQDNLASWFILFANWDGQHYLLLAERGYSFHMDSPAFYPLYPGLINLLSHIFPPAVSAVLLSYVFTAGFSLFLYRITAHFSRSKAQLTVLLVMTFPTAFFFSAFYTESLFLFLETGFLYHLFVTRSKAGLIYLMLLPLTRPSAVFIFGGLILYTLFEYATYRIEVSKHKKQTRKSLSHRRFDWRYLLYLGVAFMAGVAAYLLIMLLQTGSPFSGITTQNNFMAGNRIANLFNPAIFLQNLFANTDQLFSYTNSINDRIFMVLSLACGAFFIAFREWRLLCFYLPIVYGHIGMGVGGMSYSRLFLAGLPLLALVLAKNIRWDWPLYAVCAVGFAFQVYLARLFSLNLWVG